MPDPTMNNLLITNLGKFSDWVTYLSLVSRLRLRSILGVQGCYQCLGVLERVWTTSCLLAHPSGSVKLVGMTSAEDKPAALHKASRLVVVPLSRSRFLVHRPVQRGGGASRVDCGCWSMLAVL